MNINFLSLAANVGKRIKSKEPRAALSVRGIPLVLRQYNTIKKDTDGNFKLSVAAGYKHNKIKKIIKNTEIDLYVNPNYASTNQAESIRIYLENNEANNVMIIHGDLLFSTIRYNYSESFVVYDTDNNFRDDEVGLNIQNGYINNMSYGLDTKWSQMFYVAGKELEILKNLCSDTNFKKYLLTFEVINSIISRGGKFKAVPQEGAIFEIDTINDINNLEP
jgi:CTP:phosphocholine cytidylyltransferase-like protein